MKLIDTIFAAALLFGLTSITVNGQVNDNDKSYVVADEMPKFPRGEEAFRKYITDHVNYPETAYKNGIQGKVYVSFHVLQDGSISDAKVIRRVDSSLDKEALRVVKSLPDFKPGI